jgi:cobalt-zinc-cadmium efflux system membrane fusion protein
MITPSPQRGAARAPRAFAPLAAAALFALPLACGHESKPEAPHAPPGEAWLSPQQMSSGQVVTQQLEERDLGSSITTSGKVAFDDQKVAHIFSPVTGRVVEVLASLGMRVDKGAALAIIDSPDLGQAKSDVDKAEADLTAAEHELARQKELVAAQAGARRDLEQAEDNQLKARSEVERARERLKLLHGEEGSGERFVLRSPIAGEVIARSLNPGIEVQGQYAGGTAVELFTVGAIDAVWIWADLFEMDSAAVQKGAALSAQVPAYPGRDFTGRVDWVSPALDPTTRTARVRCVLQNPRGELKPEMYATVRISTGQRRALAVPRSAVLRIGEQTVVFVQDGRTEGGLFKFQRRSVRVDENAAGDLLPVIDGLQRGDVVVTSGGLQLTSMT